MTVNRWVLACCAGVVFCLGGFVGTLTASKCKDTIGQADCSEIVKQAFDGGLKMGKDARCAKATDWTQRRCDALEGVRDGLNKQEYTYYAAECHWPVPPTPTPAPSSEGRYSNTRMYPQGYLEQNQCRRRDGTPVPCEPICGMWDRTRVRQCYTPERGVWMEEKP